MKKLFSTLLLLLCLFVFSQTEEKQWVRAFPITDYTVDINDSVKLVQIQIPENIVKEKQIGVLKGIYRDNLSDTLEIGAGKCYLIKGEYHYFAINYKKSKKIPKAGDLLFTIVEKMPVYKNDIVNLALLYIGLKDVDDQSFYDRTTVFSNWTKEDEAKILDLMIKDIQYTGAYFLKNNPEIDQNIITGKHKGKKILNTMILCKKQDVVDFLKYMTIKPKLYYGNEWKLSEVFATWLAAGAPTIIQE